MIFQTFKSMVAHSLVGTQFEGVDIFPGPDLPYTPNDFVVLTPSSGPGFNTDGLIDTESWQVRVAGKQDNYDHAELLSKTIDQAFARRSSGLLDGVYLISSQRAGSGPYALLRDEANRTHFVCNYLIETGSD